MKKLEHPLLMAIGGLIAIYFGASEEVALGMIFGSLLAQFYGDKK